MTDPQPRESEILVPATVQAHFKNNGALSEGQRIKLQNRLTQVLQAALANSDLVPDSMAEMESLEYTTTVTVGVPVQKVEATELEKVLNKATFMRGFDDDQTGGIMTIPMTLLTEQDLRSICELSNTTGGCPAFVDVTDWPGFIFAMDELKDEDAINEEFPPEYYSEQFRTLLLEIVTRYPGINWLRLRRDGTPYEHFQASNPASRLRVEVKEVNPFATKGAM